MDAPELLADLTADGFELTAQGGSLVVIPASRLTEDQRAAVRTLKADLLALVAGRDARTTHAGRVGRLVRWGWDRTDAADVAHRLALRDGADDDRASCAECQIYSRGRCGNHRAAGLRTPDVGRDLASLLQHCPGFSPVAPQPVAATGRNPKETAR